MTAVEEVAAVDELITGLVAEVREIQNPPDPLGVDGADVKVGDRFIGHDQPVCHVRLAGAPGDTYAYCRRPDGHDPRHPHLETESRSSVMNSTVVWVWGKGEAPLVEVAEEVTDPADAKLESYEVGAFVAYRDKRRVLVIVSKPRKRDETVEVLDLTHQRMVKIRKENLVPRRPDDPTPTPEQFQWVGRWLAERRKKALEVAKRELANGRWNRSTMNQSLEKLDIAPLPAKYGGTVEFTIKFEFPDGVQPTREQVQRLIQQAIVRDHGEFSVTALMNWYGGNPTEVAG